MRNAVSNVVPAWADIRIASHGKLLGTQIGPGATDIVAWEAPLKRYLDRCCLLASLAEGIYRTSLLYRMVCVSTLAYVC